MNYDFQRWDIKQIAGLKTWQQGWLKEQTGWKQKGNFMIVKDGIPFQNHFKSDFPAYWLKP